MFIQGDALNLPIDKNQIHLVVASPPYGVGMNYEQGDVNPRYYWGFTESWLREAYRVLIPGGYCAVNIPLSTKVFGNAFYPKFYWIARVVGFHDADFSVVWVKRFDVSGNLMQRRFQKPTYNGKLSMGFANEMILGLKKPGPQREVGVDLTGQDMKQWGTSVWSIQPESDRTHPAPFPITIPYRLIKILSNPGDTVLDPFIGSGTSYRAAEKLGRIPIGIDICWNYVRQRNERR